MLLGLPMAVWKPCRSCARRVLAERLGREALRQVLSQLAGVHGLPLARPARPQEGQQPEAHRGCDEPSGTHGPGPPVCP